MLHDTTAPGPRRSNRLHASALAGIAIMMLGAPVSAGGGGTDSPEAFDSLEWGTIDADIVVRGVVTAAKRIEPTGGRYDVTLQVAETLKGPEAKTVRFVVSNFDMNTPEDWRASKADLVVFLVDSKRRVSEDAVYAKAPLALRSGAALTETVIWGHASVIELANAKPYSASLSQLTKRDAILDAVRAQAKSTAKSRTIYVPDEATLEGLGHRANGATLRVPIDGALEKRALGWIASQELWLRATGAGALEDFKSPNNIKELTRLLVDPGVMTGHASRYYPVRSAAHDVLTAWGIAHAAPIVEEPLLLRQ